MTKYAIKGYCHKKFEKVRTAFEENFFKHHEIGSAVCVYQEEEKVVDLWGGHVDAGLLIEWQKDTICLMYSVAKSICALCIHMLSDRGQIDLEKPVSIYWPEFGSFNKSDIKVRHILSHWCGVWSNENSKPGDIYDVAAMRKAISTQMPEWPAETKGAYNTINIGFICDAIVENVAGKTIQMFIEDEIAKPLNLNYYLGVPDERLSLCAEIIANPADAIHDAKNDPNSPVKRAWRAFPEKYGVVDQNSLQFKKAGIPSFGGFGDARSMAKLYAALSNGGELFGFKLISSPSIQNALRLQWSDMSDGLLKRPTAMAMGFMKNPPDGNATFSKFPDSFGHLGSGGARAFGIPSKRIAGAFISNFQSERRGHGIRTESFINSVGACI